MSGTHETFSDWDGAYVLGALDREDRRDFEAHLAECERCRTAVAELAALPGLLARVRPEALADSGAADPDIASLDSSDPDIPGLALPDIAGPAEVVHRSRDIDPARADSDSDVPAAGPPGPSDLTEAADLAAPTNLTALPDLAVPSDLIGRIERRAGQRRRSRRIRMALAVMAAVIVTAVAIGIPVLIGQREPAPETTVDMVPVAESAMTAQIGLTSVPWGTRLSVDCDYPAGHTWGNADGPWSYALVVTDVTGVSTQVSTWKAVPGKTITLSAATSAKLDSIVSFEIRTVAGETILDGEV